MLYSIQRLVGRYYAWFDPAAADSATVVLITITWMVCSLMFYALLIGGTPKLAVLGVFGLFGAQEVHHVVESLNKRGGDALDVTWEVLPLHYQGFILGVIKGTGAGSIGVSLALLIMIALPFRRGEAWARWAVPVVGITFTLLTAHAAYTIDVRTAASPPWRQTLGLTGIYVTGAVLSLLPRRVKAPATEP